MMFRTKENQYKHDLGVAKYVKLLANKGLKVFADLPNTAKPPKIGAFIPDIYAVSSLHEIVVEVETVESKYTDHALMQAATFTSWASASTKRRFFRQVV